MVKCLLLIDLINDCLDHLPADDLRRVIDAANGLVDAFRRACLPVIWVRQEFAQDLSDAFPEMRSKRIYVSILGTRGAQIHADLHVLPADDVVIKKRYSAFFGTELDTTLAGLGADELVLCGVNTHACIRTAAIDAYQRDLAVAIATDATASYDARHAEVSLAYMKDRIARLMTNAEITASLEPFS